jgi:hypothetical protein
MQSSLQLEVFDGGSDSGSALNCFDRYCDIAFRSDPRLSLKCKGQDLTPQATPEGQVMENKRTYSLSEILHTL